MTALDHARNDGQPTLAGRMETTMESFLWLADWDEKLPIDTHGRIVSDSSSAVAPIRL
jgi:hypothetical protein